MRQRPLFDRKPAVWRCDATLPADPATDQGSRERHVAVGIQRQRRRRAASGMEPTLKEKYLAISAAQTRRSLQI